MARVILTFEDNGDEQIVTYDSSTGASLDSNMDAMTDAEYLAACAVILLQKHLTEEGANVEFVSKNKDKFN